RDLTDWSLFLARSRLMSKPYPNTSRLEWCFEWATRLLVFYSIADYYAEVELSGGGYIPATPGFWLWSERVITALFIIEYAIRWSMSPNKLRYPLTVLALIDLVAILPYFLGLIVDLRSLKLLRTLRIFRLFKLYRHNRALHTVLRGFGR